MTKKITFFLFLGILFFGISLTLNLPQKAFAKTSGGIEKQIFVGENEVINNNFVRAGETVDINGKVNGDIVVAGGTVNIDSTVQGDVIAVGGTVRVKGNIAGNVRVGGGTVEIDAVIGKNANVFGGTIMISEDSTIGWSLAYGAGTADLRGKIAGHLDGAAGQTTIAATIGGDANLILDEEAITSISAPTVIEGNLTYTGETPPTIQEGAIVKGEIIAKSAFFAAPKKSDLLAFFGISTLFFKLVNLFGLLVIGLIIITLLKKDSLAIAEYMKKEPLKSISWGIVYLIVTPIVSLLLVFTIIGAPLALIISAFYLIALYVSKVFVGIFLGKEILTYFRKDKKDQSVSLMGAMILGLIIFSLLTFIPLLGWFIGLVGIIWTLGALVEIKKRYLKENKAS